MRLATTSIWQDFQFYSDIILWKLHFFSEIILQNFQFYSFGNHPTKFAIAILFNDCSVKLTISVFICQKLYFFMWCFNEIRNKFLQLFDNFFFFPQNFFFCICLMKILMHPLKKFAINSCNCLIKIHFFTQPFKEICNKFSQLFDENFDTLCDLLMRFAI